MMFRIKEAAVKLGISKSTLRRLEEKGLISPQRTPGGHRLYTQKMLENLRFELRDFPGASKILPFLDGIDVGD